MDLVVAGTDDAVMMVESEIQELTEDEVLGGVMFAHRGIQPVIDAIIELAEHAAKEPFDFHAEDTDAVKAEVKKLVGDGPHGGLQDHGQGRAPRRRRRAPRPRPLAALVKSEANPDGHRADQVRRRLQGAARPTSCAATSSSTGKRIDGRAVDKVRPIVSEVGVLPRAHGSALFTRGETQALVVATLGTGDDEQFIDALEGTYKESFLLHYNFPPYLGRRDRPHGRAGPSRNRPRQAGLAGDPADAADARRSSPTRSAWSRRSPSPTAPRRWPRSAARRWR